MPGAFAAFAVAPHYIDDSRFFSALPFSDPKMIMSATAVFAGVPVGSTTLLPVGKYVPDVAVANFLGKDVYVTIGYARSSGSNSMVQQIASVTVPATSTRELTLENLEGDPDLKDSFLISSDAPPGAVITKLVAKSGSRLREVELLGKDEKEQTTGGGHPWSVEEGNESTLLLFNHSNDSQYFNVLISSGRDLWQKAYKLWPKETEAINIRTLIHDQIKDDAGRVLPSDAEKGEVGWWNPDVGQGKGRLLQSNRSTAMARSFSCSLLRGLCGVQFTPQIVTFGSGQTVLFGNAEPIICEIQAINQCGGLLNSVGGGGYSTSWVSQYASIASISGATTQPNVNLLGASPGVSNVTATIRSAYCAPQGGGPATVQTPTSLKVLSVNVLQTGNAGDHGCLAGYYGIQVDVKYQVLDGQNPPQPIKSATMTPTEHVVVWDGTTKDGNIGPTYISTTSKTTRSDGTFDDAPVGACKAVPFNTPLTTSQDISILLSNGQTYKVRHNDFKFSSTNLLNHGTVTNGGDINKTQ